MITASHCVCPTDYSEREKLKTCNEGKERIKVEKKYKIIAHFYKINYIKLLFLHYMKLIQNDFKTQKMNYTPASNSTFIFRIFLQPRDLVEFITLNYLKSKTSSCKDIGIQI